MFQILQKNILFCSDRIDFVNIRNKKKQTIPLHHPISIQQSRVKNLASTFLWSYTLNFYSTNGTTVQRLLWWALFFLLRTLIWIQGCRCLGARNKISGRKSPKSASGRGCDLFWRREISGRKQISFFRMISKSNLIVLVLKGSTCFALIMCVRLAWTGQFRGSVITQHDLAQREANPKAKNTPEPRKKNRSIRTIYRVCRLTRLRFAEYELKR